MQKQYNSTDKKSQFQLLSYYYLAPPVASYHGNHFENPSTRNTTFFVSTVLRVTRQFFFPLVLLCAANTTLFGSLPATETSVSQPLPPGLISFSLYSLIEFHPRNENIEFLFVVVFSPPTLRGESQHQAADEADCAATQRHPSP